MRIGQMSPELRGAAAQLRYCEAVRNLRHRAGLAAVQQMGFPFIRIPNGAQIPGTERVHELPTTPYFFHLILTGRTRWSRNPRVRLFANVYRYVGDLAEHQFSCSLCSNGHGNCCTDWAALTQRPIKL